VGDTVCELTGGLVPPPPSLAIAAPGGDAEEPHCVAAVVVDSATILAV